METRCSLKASKPTRQTPTPRYTVAFGCWRGGGYTPCLFGRKKDAESNLDADEIVVRVEYRITRKFRASRSKGKP